MSDYLYNFDLFRLVKLLQRRTNLGLFGDGRTVFKFKFLILLLTPAFLVNAPSASAAEGDDFKGENGEAVAEYVELIHRRLGFSGVVLAAKNGKIVAQIARGKLDEQSATPLGLRSVFEIASCTKPFTAIAILKLAEQGKLSLDDSIAQHLPGVPSDCRGITVRHLLSHTSGIPGTNTNGTGDDINRVITTFLDGGPKHRPGQHYEYWNQGYALLSEIIAVASGLSYTEYIHQEIFKSVDMRSSCFTGESAPGNATVATGKSIRGASRSALQHPYGSYGFQYRGMGGLVTNAQDLWKWDRALHAQKLVSGKAIRQMTKPGPGGYGLGWRIANGPDGNSMHHHSGSVRGFVADVRRYPSIDGAIFVLSNHDDSLPMTLLSDGVEQILFGKQPATAIPESPDISLTDRIEGEYFDAKGRRLTIESGSGLPSIKIFWGGPVTAGYVGLDDSAVPQLYMISRATGNTVFKADGPLEFGSGKEASSVSLLSLKPKLTFQRRVNGR